MGGDEANGGNSATSNTPRPLRADCAQCGISLEWASLLLACDHHLCLACSAKALIRKSTGPLVQCSVCSTVTNVDESAAHYLEGLRPDLAKNPSAAGAPPHSATTAGPPGSGSRRPSLSPRSDKASDSISEAPPSQTAFSQPRPYASSGLEAKRDVDVNGATNGVAISNFAQEVRAQKHSAAQPSQIGKVGSASLQPATRRLCGQCEENQAALFCEQCEEHFCNDCSRVLHARGRMVQHQLKALGSGEETSSAPSRPSRAPESKSPSWQADEAAALAGGEVPPKWKVPAPTPMVPLPRRFLRCPIHPEEPLQFFCLTCDSDCICAECALHGDHRGHDVLNVREAAVGLPDRLHKLSQRAQARAEEIAGIIEHAKDGRRELANIAAQGRREVRAAFDKLRATLQEEEAALLSEVERCTADVSEILTIEDPPSEAHARSCHDNLQRHHRGPASSDVVQALNWYAKAKKAHADPLPLRPDIGADLHTQLRGQLQRGFQARLAGVAAVAQQVNDLIVASLKTSTTPLDTSRAGSPALSASWHGSVPQLDIARAGGATSSASGAEWPTLHTDGDERGPPRLAGASRGTGDSRLTSPRSDTGAGHQRPPSGVTSGSKLAAWAAAADDVAAERDQRGAFGSEAEWRLAAHAAPIRNGVVLPSPGADGSNAPGPHLRSVNMLR